MKYAEMQQKIAAERYESAKQGEKPEQEQPPATPTRASAPRPQSKSAVPFRLYRLTRPIGEHEYAGHVTVNGAQYEILACVVVDASGTKSFEGTVERVSGRQLFRGAKLEGDRSAMPQDLVAMMDEPNDSLAGVGGVP